MKILFTGASSFTGYWFVKELVESGHQVLTTFTKKELSEYNGIRKERVGKILELCKPIFNCKFGEKLFLEIIDSESNWDLLCHHAADVNDYRSRSFNISSALKNNTCNLDKVIEILGKRNCKVVILSGSVFEQGEGAGSDELKAFSPYGISKAFTYEVFRYFTDLYNIILGKFVIPNPFGPYEEFRYTTYLMKSWVNGETPIVKTPEYVRDNIHVDLLAKVYVKYANNLFKNMTLTKINPSGYIETQGMFTERFTKEIKKRSDLKCEFILDNQIEFLEPEVRINTEVAKEYVKKWDEKAAWDNLVEYYLHHLFLAK